MIDRQHVWVGPRRRPSRRPARRAWLAATAGRTPTAGRSPDAALIDGTLRRDADVGFTTCPRGHRVVVRRVGRQLARLH